MKKQDDHLFKIGEIAKILGITRKTILVYEDRGPYEGIGTSIATLNTYVETNHIQTTGPFRSIFLEGPPSRGEQSSDYITQIVVPI